MPEFLARVICLAGMVTLLGAQEQRDREQPEYRDPRLAEPGQIAPILEGLGDHHHLITTASERAQVFFDQGLRLTYAFNHRESARAFREATRLDPECAMAYWGLALVHGPNLNMPMSDESARIAYDSIQKAMSLRSRVSARERAYIESLSNRYSSDPVADRRPLDEAYASAMKQLTEAYPEDNDAATLYAAALMNLSPWDYWWANGEPYKRTREFLAILSSVIERDPRHAGAHHYYIHATEAQHPEWAVRNAEILESLMPGAGHMVHMPSHIYMRVGRYAEAYESNVKAVAADEGYITQCRAQGIYPLAYYPHNLHFLWSAATNQGRSREAIEAARKVASKMPQDALRGSPSFQTFLVVPYYALTRFGKWDEILAEPRPADDLSFARAIWHYARGNAYAAKQDHESADRELRDLKALAGSPRVRALMWASPPADVLAIAVRCLAGEIATRQGRFEEGINELATAVRLQDALPYNEPPDWHYPVRLSLGAALLAAGRAKEAEVVYWEDLRQNPENGWSLFGLWQSLSAQGKDDAARSIGDRFKRAWVDADVELTSSRF